MKRKSTKKSGARKLTPRRAKAARNRDVSASGSDVNDLIRSALSDDRDGWPTEEEFLRV